MSCKQQLILFGLPFLVVIFNYENHALSHYLQTPHHLSHNVKCKDIHCIHGECINGSCICRDGWQGYFCQHCGGKIRLSDQHGYITDGNGSYNVDVKCSWLVDAGVNSTVRFHIEELSTEFGWDYVYIYDGDNIHSPILAVLSGLMIRRGYSIRKIPEIVTTSRFALIHFYSDTAVSMPGFNISYKLNSCPSWGSLKDCSGNGVCIEGTCTCDASYMGDACDVPICPNNCSYSNGMCIREQHRCECNSGFKGDDCSQNANEGVWEVVKPKDFVPYGSASHSTVVWRDSMHVIGGESYNKGEFTYVYDFNGNVWEKPRMDGQNMPTRRYLHSSVIFGDKIYLYGGMSESGEIFGDIWSYDITSKSWENITVRPTRCVGGGNGVGMCGPLKVIGHTATLYTSKTKRAEMMIVVFGYSPTFGFLSTVQEFHYGTREWKIVNTNSYSIKGGYGHSSVFDPATELIYIFGGYTSTTVSSAHLLSRLYAYNPVTRMWETLPSAPRARFLHSANILNGLMYVFGGNMYNGTVKPDNTITFSDDFLAYDIVCQRWFSLETPELNADMPRYGHSSVIFEGSMYIHGGTNGLMLNDILKYTPGNCQGLNSEESCLISRHGVKCVWDSFGRGCLPFSSTLDISEPASILDSKNVSSYGEKYSTCPSINETLVDICAQKQNCHYCAQEVECRWCEQYGICVRGDHCVEVISAERDATHVIPIRSVSQCRPNEDIICQQLHTCYSCLLSSNCQWVSTPMLNSPGSMPMCVPYAFVNNTFDSQVQENLQCQSCSEYTSCSNCTDNRCLWCHNAERCVDKNAYIATFPYGECREWIAHSVKCRGPADPTFGSCSYYKTCIECQADPECGWCDNGSGTGLGTCYAGGKVTPGNCAADSWYFTHCPTCQCNGHSVCQPGSNVCIQPCKLNTYGPHCEKCIHGYYGNALNGGHCQPCECNNQANQCHSETGKCFCSTKGVIGDHCDKCDYQNHYQGDPTLPHGSCFYDLTIDYQFTFNLSKKEDRHYRQINFKNSPTKSEVDADFNILCSVPAKMNITMKMAGHLEEKPIIIGHNCTSYRTKFPKSNYNYGTEDNTTLTTFYVYMYDFHPPLWIQISFSQYPKLNLQQFFITFSSCFLLLLLVAAVMWKLKQRYDAFRRRLRLHVEMEQMASRAFSTIYLNLPEQTRECEDDDVATISVSKTLGRRIKNHPSSIATEPCSNNKAAVVSFIVHLPTGSNEYAPSGQAGICIGSALVTTASLPRKVSVDDAVKQVKPKPSKSNTIPLIATS